MAVSSGSPIGGGDFRALQQLRSNASTDPKAAVREAAKQFEGMFMQQLLKSMREASVSTGMLDNAGTKMGNDMLDTQLVSKMTGQAGGLSDIIAHQLDKQLSQPLANIAAEAAAAKTGAVDTTKQAPVSLNTLQGKDRQIGFLKLHDGAAKAAEAATGIPASFMVAQAAHESGWGRHEIKNSDGSTSFNVFGIKAGGSWKGPTTEVTTTEVVDGQAHKVKAKFRAYGSYEEAFTDYAKMMKDNPRYSKVVADAATPQGFAQGLQKAGYATDPAYADKLTRMINTTLRLQRASA
jgi:flagellar protein FlgJ